ncbi:uncharacterized protein [Temnothorax longispinosus]|uniref:uncharacterized protein n=1 Tax=Temnothorax longispinosus TaxID=300112 RepID=UPI003A9A0710
MDIGVIASSIVALAYQMRKVIDEVFCDNDDDDDESDDEIEIMLATVMHEEKEVGPKPARCQNFVELVVPRFTFKQFQENFRMSAPAFERLLTVIAPLLENRTGTGRPTTKIEKQLLAVVWLLATPDCFRSIGMKFDMSKSTLHSCFRRVIVALVSISHRLITWPTGEKLERTVQKFTDIAGMAGVIGAIDGCYVPIDAPQVDAQYYRTRKCEYAITLQAVCDPELRFTDVFAGYPGSVGDLRVFRNSPLYRDTEANVQNFFPNGEYIIGDKAYNPPLPWCISPYKNIGHLTAIQISFNTILSKTRQTIERTFGLLKGRFRRLRHLSMVCYEEIPDTILACCVLHNICLQQEDDFLELYIEEELPFVYGNEGDEIGQYEPAGETGGAKRDRLAAALANH